MSSKQATTSDWQNTKQLFRYRVRTQLHLVYYLLFFQLIGLAIMFFGADNSFNINGGLVESYASTNVTFSLSLLAIGLVSFLLSLQSQRRHFFAYVRTTRTEHYSAFLYLLALCFIATTTSIATPYLTSIFFYTSYSAVIHSDLPSNFTSVSGFLLSFGVALTYFILISALGYFISSLIQISRFFISLLIFPFILFPTLFSNILIFFMIENHPVIFFIKTIGISILLLLGAMALLNKEEVAS
ncbi:hypothetical protein JOC54_004298 [Alkalihalobacillus xiaoxiensis]|uniref:ABC transporter permease n=1 Tax=Shouchella xiaoxiensis TaxID=766895 RepID=A0ABS2T2S5_9BACI|nr:hypothetical protein [Shouchella xiaoxiensis]MBM7840999.1 hypothetical protein [Shouchella xiaoxiensis]